jgi:hypothetical protein
VVKARLIYVPDVSIASEDYRSFYTIFTLRDDPMTELKDDVFIIFAFLLPLQSYL